MNEIPSCRVGCGYDVHRLVPGRRLVLGGVRIPGDYGLDGHSDADCLCHALADALLGALGLPDIGHFFPNTDPSLAGMDSRLIVRRAVAEIRTRGYRVGNASLTVIAEKPKLAPYREAICRELADCLEVEADQVGLQVTTHEGLGSLGRAEGIAAQAVVLVFRETTGRK